MKSKSEHTAEITVFLPLGVGGNCGGGFTGGQQTLALWARSDESQDVARRILAEAVERIITVAATR